MSPQRFALLFLCIVGIPTLLTFLSLLRAHPQRNSASEAEQTSSTNGIRALFSFHTPSTLFPPSAIISLTDDNSTFFLARPADFGPALVSDGLSGQLWIGSGFGDGGTGQVGGDSGAEGELGCSDVPGWEEGGQSHRKEEDVQSHKDDAKVNHHTAGDETYTASSKTEHQPSEDDGTDDHLHHPLPSSSVAKTRNPGQPAEHEDHRDGSVATHGDIQSLQESAEISGKIVLLSRGGCGFLEKVKWAQRRGATALIVGDHTRGGALVTMYARGDTSNVSIPSLFTSHTTAHLLSTLIPPEDSKRDYWRQRKQMIGSGSSSNSDLVNRKPLSKSTHDDDRPTFTRAVDSKATTPVLKSAKGQSSRFTGSGTSKSQKPKKRWFGLGRRSDSNTPVKDSTRPPSSGQHDWFGSSWAGTKKRPSKEEGSKVKETSKESWWPGSPAKSGDDFVIGVQDWRDPDLVAAKAPVHKGATSPASSSPSATATPSNKVGKDEDVDKANSNSFSGGSITPSSGEYHHSGQRISANDQEDGGVNPEENRQPYTSDEEFENIPVVESQGEYKIKSAEQHEGLWVTLTPTTMSTSPFFDTLLVLVVSPLVTLTVVYALLLLRSRIRRRRWRAPKSVVDQLPIHTYQTMASSSTTSSTRYVSPEASSPSSPLLHSEPRLGPRSRPRSATATGIGEAVSESLERATTKAAIIGRATNSSLKKAYRGRQIECVVCLEEYVEGKSKVMSLPCGHEFHAECITPWLTTRRRTCPICKGDVVRSLAHSSSKNNAPARPDGYNSSDDVQVQAAQTTNDSPTAAIPIPSSNDLERGEDMAATLVNDQPESSYAPRSGWRGLASMSLSAFSGRGERSERKEDDRDR